MATTRKPRVKSTPAPILTAAPRRPRPDDEDGGFTDFLTTMRKRWSEVVVKSSQPLFHTDVPNLYDIFLQNLSAELRPHYACRCCRKFVERFGNVVTVQKGKLQSALWQGMQSMPEAFKAAVDAMCSTVEAATITGVVVSGADTFGTPFSLADDYGTQTWTHMAVEWPVARRFNSQLKTADAHAAVLKEERKMLERGLSEFSVDHLNTALALFTSGTLTRPEKGQPLVQWVLDQHASLSKLKGSAREHALWQIAVTAPAGFCHIRSGVVGTLLEDIVAGYDVATLAKRWAEKLDPAQYMRAQVAPAAGQLKRAESVIEKLAASGSLTRRYAQVGDIAEAIWTRFPDVASQPSGPVFGHIAAKQKKPAAATLDFPEVRMTWDKFKRTMLPDATSIEYHVPAATVQFGALVTAANPEAPPILQWDDAAKRNPVSVYSAQSEPQNWGLLPGTFAPVNLITPMPYHWNGAATPNQKQGVLFSIEGCSDRRRQTGGGFLPEFLRSDLREIRSALDAYAKQATVAPVTEPVCGLALMNTTEVATTKAAPLGKDTDVILVFDESGSMSGKLREINAQAEAIRQRLSIDMPQARVRVLRFGTDIQWAPSVLAQNFQPLRLDSNRGGTSLHRAISTACEAAQSSGNATLIYLLTDGEATDSQGCAPQLIASVLASGRVTFGCVGPAAAYRFFTNCGIPSACVRAWDGYSVRDLNTVTAEVAQGITSFAAARSSGATSISDFFTAPVSGFGDGVRLRVTSKGQRQIICLDRWD